MADAPTLKEQIALVKRIAHLWPYHASEADRQTMIAAGKSLEAQLEPAVYEGRRQHARRVAELDVAAEAQPARDAMTEAALNYVADMTYCGADAEWHFKPGYDPQIVLDALAALPPAPEVFMPTPIPCPYCGQDIAMGKEHTADCPVLPPAPDKEG